MANTKIPRICQTCGNASGGNKFCGKSCWSQYTLNNVAARFWVKVQKAVGCWLWTGNRASGYGAMQMWRKGKYVKVGAHVISYELAHGEVPDGLYVLHRCDNPPCVNPDHLFLGTQFENMQDMKVKGRARWANRKKF